MSPSDQKRWLADQLYEVRDKILCVVPGNRERNKRDVMIILCTTFVASWILKSYRPNAAFMIIRIGDKGNGLKIQPIPYVRS